MKSALIIDLDGTLLNSKKEISELNMSIIDRCITNGNIIIIATARPLRTVINKFSEKNIPNYLVLCNGAWIYNKGKVISRNEIHFEEVHKICGRLISIGHKPMIEANNKFYSTGNRESWFEGDIFALEEYKNENACKILAHNDNDNGINEKEIKDIIKEDYTVVITDNGTLMQISKKNCTKLSACEIILKNENVNWNNTYAFGDDKNDLPVFEKVANGIAMENATDELKKKSKWITLSNDNDGVGVAIEKYVLKANKY